MATAKKADTSASMKAYPHISSVAPSDFGLKAGFWNQQKAGTITFRPIVGWVSVTNYIDAGRLPFVGVVLNDEDSPSLASKASFPDFVGYFKNSVSADEARKIIEREGIRVGGVRGAGRPVE
jgi:hypothetical protein